MNPIDEQIRWWVEQEYPAHEAHEALYGKSPYVMTWHRLRERMIQDFGPKLGRLRRAA